MFGSFGQAPLNEADFLRSATLPEPAAIAIVPVASGAGSVTPLLPPELSGMSQYSLRSSVTAFRGVTDHVDDVALAYCTDHPLRSTGDVPALNISMKSFRNGAPEFPPPPKT